MELSIWLVRLIQQRNSEQIMDLMLQKGIKWSFNPPAGSHHGGPWERLMRSPSLPPGVFQAADVYAHRRWKQVQYMSDLFWKRWVKEYLPQLQERQKWTGERRNLNVGDLILIMDSTAPQNSCLIWRVIQTFPERQGFVRQVRIKTRTSCLDRPITKICLLQEAEAG